MRSRGVQKESFLKGLRANNVQMEKIKGHIFDVTL